ncbi:MAG: leucyl aminopeptidase family protein [Gammaproteobacteria bacterium]|nr:leucyl aminopeptidase family protein [Gammaproteobacteria bacterium]
MKAQQFYQSTSEACIPVTVISFEDYEAGAHLSEQDGRALSSLQFSAKLGDVALLLNDQGALEKVYIGSGDASDVLAVASGVIKLPAGIYRITTDISERAILAWSFAQYKFDTYQNNCVMPCVLEVEATCLERVVTQSDAVFTTRDLINMPPNALNPETLAHTVIELAEVHQAHCQVWVGAELLEFNYPAVHAVGRASDTEPRVISMTWGDESHPRVTLVGKGVCFDSGGLDLKTAAGMRFMKKDMGGAAHVIGLAKWMMTAKLPIRLHVLIPAVENAVNADAYRPGDVLIMRDGTSVEIDNTDAEGRLILADVLVNACEHGPELLIDFATLTGAARIAVGTDIAALFSNNPTLATDIVEQGLCLEDPIWQMPLFSGYKYLFESRIADLANSSPSPYGGAITAALFLQHFVNPDIDWLHFDIMAWNVSARPGKPEGGEAMGVLAVGQYLLDRYQK